MFQFLKKIFLSKTKNKPITRIPVQSSYSTQQRHSDVTNVSLLSEIDENIINSSRTLDTNKYEPLEVKSYVSTTRSDYEDSSRSSRYSDDDSRSSSSYSSCSSSSSSWDSCSSSSD